MSLDFVLMCVVREGYGNVILFTHVQYISDYYIYKKNDVNYRVIVS